MKILFINKHDISGGAAIWCFRFHKTLERLYNTQNYFLVGIKKSNYPYIFETRKRGFQNFVERGWNFLLQRIGLQYKFFPFSTKTILKKTKEIQPDIIFIRNIHGGYFKTSLLISLSKQAPIVWSLPDMWAFTANAAHTFGDISWKEMRSGKKEKKNFPKMWIDTGKWLLQQKKKIYSQSNLTIVTPSRWLYNLAIQSPVFEGKQILHIPNGIDTNIFYPQSKTELRKKINIEENTKVLLFNSEQLFKSPYKGGKELLDILELLHVTTEEKICLIVIGEGKSEVLQKFSKFDIRMTGYLKDEKTIIDYLNIADIFIYPTKADNLPNTLLEAIACGLPCITFDVGGCGEIVENNKNGFLIPPFDKKLFTQRIKELLHNDEMRKQFSFNARKIAEEKYSITTTAEKYYTLFKSLL